MAKKNIEKLKDKNSEDLGKELMKERQNLQQLKFDLARGKVKNSAAVRASKRKIARLATLMKEKELVKANTQNG